MSRRASSNQRKMKRHMIKSLKVETFSQVIKRKLKEKVKKTIESVGICLDDFKDEDRETLTKEINGRDTVSADVSGD